MTVRASSAHGTGKKKYFKGQSAPGVPDLQGRLQVLRGKEEVARTEVETFMEHCAKRWQTKEGTYQLKRHRLLRDVRDCES